MTDRPDLGIYDAVWREPQNVDVAEYLRDRIRLDCDGILAIVQPGDMTRYEIELTRIDSSELHIATVSDEGREPKSDHMFTPAPTLLVEVLNEDFAERPAVFKSPGFVTAGVATEKLGIRNICTAMAVAATINELWVDA